MSRRSGGISTVVNTDLTGTDLSGATMIRTRFRGTFMPDGMANNADCM